MELIPTNTHSHVTFDPDPKTYIRRARDGKIVPVYRTVHSQITTKLWEEHFAGTYPLVAPLACDDGTTKVSVVDIDDYTVDAFKIADKLKPFGLPFYTRMSKSNGAHVYVFHIVPISIFESIKVCRGIARLLGYEDKAKGIEYFPMVQSTDAEPRCLNMPYLGNTRGFVNGTVGEITAEEFLSSVQFLTNEQRQIIINTEEPLQPKPKATSLEAGRHAQQPNLASSFNTCMAIT
jgi:hypothetical protein